MKKVVVFLFAMFGFSSLTFAQEEASESTVENAPAVAESPSADEGTEQEGFRSNWFVGVGEGAVVNKFKDNWFVGGGPDVHFFSGHPSNGSMFSHTSVGFQLYGGKWLTPDFGCRFGIQGISVKDYNKESMTYFDFNWNLMLNVQNIFMGYSENRVWNIAPYMGPALVISKTNRTNSTHYGIGLVTGLHNTFNMNNIIPKIGDKVFFTFDLGVTLDDQEFDGYIVHPYGLDAIYSISIGAIYRFPKRGWTSSFIMY